MFIENECDNVAKEPGTEPMVLFSWSTSSAQPLVIAGLFTTKIFRSGGKMTDPVILPRDV